VKNLRKKASDVALDSVAPAIDFFRKIEPKDRVVILHDEDCDGVCSGVILSMVLREFCKNNPAMISTEWNTTLTRKLVKKVLAKKPEILIITDVAYMDLGLLKRLSGKSKVLVIDHHNVRKYENVVYCNPRSFDAGAYLPATCLSYKISEMLGVRNKKITWIAAVGVLGDHGVENCTDIFTKLKKEFPELLENAEIKSEKLFDGSKIGLLTKIVDAGRVAGGDDGASYAAKTLLGVKNYSEILERRTAEAKKLVAWYETVRKEFDRLVGEFKEKNVPVGDVLFFEFKSKLRIKSTLASAVENFYDDNIIVIGQKEGKHYLLSMRRGKNVKIDLDKLIRSAIKNIPNSTGGGHPQACAGRIPIVYKDVFLKNLA